MVAGVDRIMLLHECFYYSYTGVPSDLKRLIRRPSPPLPELPEKDDSASTELLPGSLRFRAALVPKSNAVRKTNMPVVTANINTSSAIRLEE